MKVLLNKVLFNGHEHLTISSTDLNIRKTLQDLTLGRPDIVRSENKLNCVISWRNLFSGLHFHPFIATCFLVNWYNKLLQIWVGLTIAYCLDNSMLL